MKTKNIGIIFILIAALFQTACVKEGPMGPAGLNGSNGSNGANGLDGNANVIASAWITPTAWSGQTNDWFFDVASADITADIVENGVILGYAWLANDLYSGATVRPMPCYVDGANWEFLVHTYGQIQFTSDAAAAPATTGNQFRFILISASKTASLKSGNVNGLRKSELQKMSYSDVCKLYGIKE